MYALVTNGPICFPSHFIQTIIKVHRNKSKKQRLFFPIFIHRILNFLELDHFPFLESLHLIAPIGATFRKQHFAQKKPADTTKRLRVKSTAEDVHFEPTAVVPDVDNEDDVKMGAANVTGPSRSTPPFSLFML